MNSQKNRMENDRMVSTSSTVSGVYRNALPVSRKNHVNFKNYFLQHSKYFPQTIWILPLKFQSPAPICMFYFAHPFGGIATPSSTSNSIDPFGGMRTVETTPNAREHQAEHLCDFVPWPRQTWQCQDVLAPLVNALQKQIGKEKSIVYFKFLKNNKSRKSLYKTVQFQHFELDMRAAKPQNEWNLRALHLHIKNILARICHNAHEIVRRLCTSDCIYKFKNNSVPRVATSLSLSRSFFSLSKNAFRLLFLWASFAI